MPLPNRRDIFATVASAAAMPLFANQKTSNPIVVENQKTGTLDWQLTYTRVDSKMRFRSSLIEGYVSKQSVSAGQSLDFFVSTDPVSSFQIDIYRLGYYGGLGGRHMKTLGPFDGLTQPLPEVGPKRLRECRWKKCVTLEIPQDWLSGVYLGKLSASKHRYQSYVIFIVTDTRKVDLLFQCSDHTWQAYNQWPDGYSLYTNDRKDGKVLVSGVQASFDRPYGKYVQIYDNPLSQGSGEFLLWEFPFSFWLERQGYDTTYCSNKDVITMPETLARAKGFLSVGHDEYWDPKQYDHLKKAITDGLNVAFFCGNSVCFVTPSTPSTDGRPNRVIERAGRYGGIREKEKPMMADLPMDGPNEANLIGAQTVTPFNGSGDWIVTKPDHWIFNGTNLKKGDRFLGLVGWEFHGEPANIPGLEVVAEGPTFTADDRESHYTATIYPGPKGNFVFNASTIFWSQGLSNPPGHMPPISHHGRPQGPDVRVQRITANVLNRMIGG